MKSAFGLLCYDDTDNLGDEIQSLAARQFLPRVDHYIDRESLNQFYRDPSERVFVIANGWYCHRPENWPPSEAITPLMIAVHISTRPSIFSGLLPTDAMLSEPAAEYLRAIGPVGARDNQTLALLKSAGIDSYFSACLTLTLRRPDVERDDDLVVLCDVPESISTFVGKNTSKKIQQVSHSGFPHREPEKRFSAASTLLQTYARASCVVTTRLHCALPCVSMGTPVFLLDMAPDQERFSGLHQFVRHAPVWVFSEGRSGFDVNNPPANPDSHLPFSKALITRVRQFVDLAESEPEFSSSLLSVEQRLFIAHQQVSRLTRLTTDKLRRHERQIKDLAQKSI